MRLALTQPPWGMEREKRRKIRRREGKAGLLFKGGQPISSLSPRRLSSRAESRAGGAAGRRRSTLGCVHGGLFFHRVYHHVSRSFPRTDRAQESTLLSPGPLCLSSSLHNEKPPPLLISALRSVTRPLLAPHAHVHIRQMIWAREDGSGPGRPRLFATTLWEERGRLLCQRRH